MRADNPVVVGIVTALTETLRILGVGEKQYKEVLQESAPLETLPPGMVSK
jgi:hypothetical protein